MAYSLWENIALTTGLPGPGKLICTLCFVDSSTSVIQRGLSRCLFSVFLKRLMR